MKLSQTSFMIQYIAKLKRLGYTTFKYHWVITFFLLDINECATHITNCTHDKQCVNTLGGHQCVCTGGYYGSSCQYGTYTVHILHSEILFFLSFSTVSMLQIVPWPLDNLFINFWKLHDIFLATFMMVRTGQWECKIRKKRVLIGQKKQKPLEDCQTDIKKLSKSNQKRF